MSTNRIIIADDDLFIRKNLRNIFANSKYAVVAEASNGFEAVEKCKLYKPDIALLDISMPKINGIAAAEVIRNEELAKCIVMLTSFDDKQCIDSAIAAGATGYLLKPIDKAEVFVTIKKCLSDSKGRYLLQKDIDKIKKRHEQDEVISRAKLIMMERKHISEQEAYNYIRQLSKRRQDSILRIAKEIVLKYNGK